MLLADPAVIKGALTALVPSLSLLLLVSIGNLVWQRARSSAAATSANWPKLLGTYEWPILGSALRFYSKRRDMLVEGQQMSKTGNFSFNVGQKHIVSVGGVEGRRALYESKKLNFAAGFVELLAGIPAIGEPIVDESFGRSVFKSIAALTRTDILQSRMETLSSDIRLMCDELAAREPSKSDDSWRVFKPFDTLYELVYKLTMRILGFSEVAEDTGVLKRTLAIFEQFESSSSTARIVFPWLITPGLVLRFIAGARFYLTFLNIIKNRQANNITRDDALDYFLRNEVDSDTIIKMQIFALYAGILTTGPSVSWLPILLSRNSEWKAKCVQEVQDAIASKRTSPQQSANDVLDTLSVQEWESMFPGIDLGLRETIRVAVPGTVFRKNTTSHDIPLGKTGEVIPAGSFATYLVDEVHMNPRLYPQPQTFDPSRFLNQSCGTGTADEPHTYVGWGSGRHPCLGMRLAKLEVAMTMVYFIANFEFQLSDADGRPVHTAPKLPDRNGYKGGKPEEAFYLRYQPRTAL